MTPTIEDTERWWNATKMNDCWTGRFWSNSWEELLEDHPDTVMELHELHKKAVKAMYQISD